MTEQVRQPYDRLCGAGASPNGNPRRMHDPVARVSGSARRTTCRHRSQRRTEKKTDREIHTKRRTETHTER
eukprot:COSAG03_NODE_16950_length_387_cov_3.027778_1_plen_70_part_10